MARDLPTRRAVVTVHSTAFAFLGSAHFRPKCGQQLERHRIPLSFVTVHER